MSHKPTLDGLVRPQTKRYVVPLRKELTRHLKRGHAWLFSDAVDTHGLAAGTVVWIQDSRERTVASGIADPEHPIPVRICRIEPPWTLDDTWFEAALTRAIQLRMGCFDNQTTGYRLVAGEGDQLPGLIIDRYAETAVIKLDQGAPLAFYRPPAIAAWLAQHLDVQHVVLRNRGQAGEYLLGGGAGQGGPERPRTNLPRLDPADFELAPFQEHGLKFSADVLHGQKTGFFLDQRDNRQLIRSMSRDRRVLNLFSYSGGFSIAAGCGGASQVCSVDLAQPAVESAQRHWEENGLPGERHQAIAADCFQFLEQAISQSKTWDIVICDPPSFAPSEKAKPQALRAYTKLAELAARVTKQGGIVALASCSSHVPRGAFAQTAADGLGRARRRGTLLADRGLPFDHPTPLAMPELRYLKFLLFQLD